MAPWVSTTEAPNVNSVVCFLSSASVIHYAQFNQGWRRERMRNGRTQIELYWGCLMRFDLNSMSCARHEIPNTFPIQLDGIMDNDPSKQLEISIL
jgi:hypothetical protein